MYPWRSAAAFPVMWDGEQSHYSNWQVWPTKGVCLCGVPWNRSCSRGPSFKWIWATWPTIEGYYLFHFLLRNNNLQFSWFHATLSSFIVPTGWALLEYFQVSAKRTNVPGMKQYRGRRPNPYAGGFRARSPFVAPFMYAPYGYGYFSGN